MEITKREILLSIAIVAILLTIGFIISGKISNIIMDRDYVYHTATQIKSNEQFKYGMDTNVGNSFIRGTMKANEPVTYNDIDGEYLSVTQKKERYTIHTRTVTTTDSNGNITSRIETYWTWDYVGEDSKTTEHVTFCDKILDFSKIKPIHEDYITTKTYGDIRYIYYGCPVKITGSMFAKLMNGTIENGAQFFKNQTIDEAIKNLTSNKQLVIFWVFWIIFIVAVVIAFYYIDNKWIEG